MAGYEFVSKKEMNDPRGSSKICSLTAGYSGEEAALIYGQLRGLFGEPVYETKNLEDQYRYCLAAVDEQGMEVSIEAYSGPSGPSVGGLQDENSRLAAEALLEKVRGTEPMDYEYEGYYLDGPSKVCCGVKAGKPFWKEEEMELGGEEFRRACKLIYPYMRE